MLQYFCNNNNGLFIFAKYLQIEIWKMRDWKLENDYNLKVQAELELKYLESPFRLEVEAGVSRLIIIPKMTLKRSLSGLTKEEQDFAALAEKSERLEPLICR
jgi:hypothetical protein